MIQIPVEPPISEFLHRKASAARIPLSGTFELTPVCNMDCKMCYVRMSRGQQEAIRPLRSAEEWLELARAAKNAGMLYLLITGGEPFLHPQIRQIMTGLHQMGFVISINTNGTLIDEETVAWLSQCPPVRLNITLYGASDETYARLCGNPRGYTQVTRGIQLLRDAGLTVKLNCSLTPHNAKDFDQIVAYAKSEGLIIQANSYMFPPLRKDANQIGINERFTPEEAAYYSAKIEAALNGEERFLEKSDEDLPSLPGDADESCADSGDIMRCRAGKCSFWITWEGKMLACGMLPATDEPNVFEEGFVNCWKETVKRTDAIRLPAACASCSMKSVCKACAAMVKTETGSFDKVPVYRCRMAASYAEQRRRLKEEILAKNT